MDKLRMNIAVIEPSDIIFEGLSNLLMKSERHYYLFRMKDLDELQMQSDRKEISVIILNPVVLQNNMPHFQKMKRSMEGVFWLSLVYSYFDNKLLSRFDETLFITDPAEIIARKMQKLLSKPPDIDKCGKPGQLTEREKKVLVQMVNGLSNKEIADNLNISIHTVISHRKNIVEKTGIKSLPGLTIYAISKKIVPLDTNPV